MYIIHQFLKIHNEICYLGLMNLFGSKIVNNKVMING